MHYEQTVYKSAKTARTRVCGKTHESKLSCCLFVKRCGSGELRCPCPLPLCRCSRLHTRLLFQVKIEQGTHHVDITLRKCVVIRLPGVLPPIPSAPAPCVPTLAGIVAAEGLPIEFDRGVGCPPLIWVDF